MKRRFLLAVALLLALSIGGAANLRADLITFTFTGIGNGTLGASAFTDALFTIVATGDTATRETVAPGIFDIEPLAVTIDIAGLGLFNVTSASRVFVNQNVLAVGWSRAGNGGSDIYNLSPIASLSTYDLLTSFGPVNDATPFFSQFNSSFGVITTNGGNLAVTSARNATFQAVVQNTAIPEPGTISLLGLGLAGVALAIRRKRS